MGPIALAEQHLLVDAVELMLIVVVPIFVMAFLFAWRYRTSNASARYAPDWSRSVAIDAVIWLVPATIIVALGLMVWRSMHRLDPYRPIDSPLEPIKVEVVAEDWKWLFIYPEQNIAAVDKLVFPSERPLSLALTSDTVMNSFSVAELGGQIYAMNGMQTRLNLVAIAPGRFEGRNTQYIGSGFTDQHFEAIATSEQDFDAWLAKVRQSPNNPDSVAYRALAARGIARATTDYSAVEPSLFDTIVARYAPESAHTSGHAAH